MGTIVGAQTSAARIRTDVLGPILWIMPRYEYIPDPATESSPLAMEDVEALLAHDAKGFAGDKRKVLHFLRRVATTIRLYRMQLDQLHRQVSSIQTSGSAIGQSTFANPAEALPFIEPAVILQYADRHLQQKYRAVCGMEEDLRARLAAMERDRRVLDSQLSSVRFAVLEILDDDSLDVAVKNRFRSLLRTPAMPVPAPPAAPGGATASPVPEAEGQADVSADDLGDLFSR